MATGINSFVFPLSWGDVCSYVLIYLSRCTSQLRQRPRGACENAHAPSLRAVQWPWGRADSQVNSTNQCPLQSKSPDKGTCWPSCPLWWSLESSLWLGSHRTDTLPAWLHGLLIRCLLNGILLVPPPRCHVGRGGLGVCGSNLWGPGLHWNNLGSTWDGGTTHAY